jgi:serine/threonine-protein kinase
MRLLAVLSLSALLLTPAVLVASAHGGRPAAHAAKHAKKSKPKHKKHKNKKHKKHGQAKQKCKVPKLKGDSLTKAKHALKQAHCTTGKITRASSSSVRKGHVISSKPKAGSKQKAGGKVSLVVSSGGKGTPVKQKVCKVPQLKGKSITEAESALKAAGCALGKVKQKSSNTVPPGRVISSNPKPGGRRKAGSKVSLTISSGPKSQKPQCVVPNVAGQSVAAAEAAVKKANCTVGKLKQKSSEKVPKDDVISTNPKAGTKHKAGAKVDLVVSTGPKTKYHIPAP